MITKRMLPAALLLVACSACASAPQPAGEGARAPSSEGARTPSRSSSRITREEIAAATYGNAYDLIQATRPRWLRVRLVGGIERVRVEIDRAQVGGVDLLRRLTLASIESIEFSDSFDLSERGAGTAEHAGTIRVTLRTGL